MKSYVAFLVVLLAILPSSLSITTIPLKKFQRDGTYLKASPDTGRARLALIKSRTARGPSTVLAANLAYVQYTMSVGIGDPPTYYNLVIDTGSSITFLLALRTTSISTGKVLNVTFGVGYFTGPEYLDQVALASNLVLANQPIGGALSSSSFQGVDGIIGVDPIDLTHGTLINDTNATVPTVMNNLASQGLVADQVLGVYFAPSTNYSDTNGALTCGGIDTSLYEDKLTYVPVTKTYPAAYYWGINITGATYGDHTIIPNSTAGIVDTGTTQILLADDLFAIYLDAIQGARLNSQMGLVEIPSSAVPSMQPLDFFIADRMFTMDVPAQLIPVDQNTAWGGVAGKQYGVLTNLGRNSGHGLDFIIGQKFIERYYAVFDADKKRVGFAQTNNTFMTHQG